MELRTGTHPHLDSRRPHPAVDIQAARLEQPLLAGGQHGQGVEQLAGRRSHEGAEHRGRIGGGTYLQGGRRIHHLPQEPLVGGDRTHEDPQAGRRTLLALMAERRAHEVCSRQVQIGLGGHDQGVLAAGLGEEPHVRVPAAEQVGRLM